MDACLAVKNRVLLSQPHSSRGSQGPEGPKSKWIPDHRHWAACVHHLLGGLECPGTRVPPKGGSLQSVRVQDGRLPRSPHPSREKAARAGCLSCGGGQTPELLYRKLLSSLTLSIRILLTFFSVSQSGKNLRNTTDPFPSPWTSVGPKSVIADLIRGQRPHNTQSVLFKYFSLK